MEDPTENNERFASVMLPEEEGIALRDRPWMTFLSVASFSAAITALLMVIYRFAIFHFMPYVSWANWWRAWLALWTSLVLSWLCLEGVKWIWRWIRQRINYIER